MPTHVENTTTMTMTRTADDEAAAVASSSASTAAMQDRINKMITMQRLQSDVARERVMASAVANAAAVSEAGGVNNDSVNGNKVAAAKSADSSSSSSSSSSLRIVLPSPRWTIRREDTDVTKDIISQRVVTTRDDSSFWTAAGSQQSMMTAIASNNIDRFMGEKETSISTSTMKMKKENNLQP